MIHDLGKIVVVLWTITMSAAACFNPADQWAAGVVWNSGEKVDFLTLEKLGKAGNNYFRKGAGDAVVYTYRSHFAPEKAMVYVGYFAISYQSDTVFPRLAVILDSAWDAKAFDFGLAVRVELDWLCNPELGFVSMSMAQRRKVQDSIKRGNSQYWTLQDSVLPYNMWFTADDTASVQGVKGTFGGCGLDQPYDPPPEELSLAGICTEYKILIGALRFAVENIRSGDVTMVDAIREADGQWYYPYMSHWPDFMNKVVTGYFERDTISGMRMIGDVFIITEMLRDVSSQVSALQAQLHCFLPPVGSALYDAVGRFRVDVCSGKEPAAAGGIIVRQTPSGSGWIVRSR